MITAWTRLFKKKITRWEYKVIPIGDPDADDFIVDSNLVLDHLGMIGWELVAVIGPHGIFKRHAQAQ